ncbi:MAG: hypothetical protein AAGI72_02700 [Pseudomonadota bacterium]
MAESISRLAVLNGWPLFWLLSVPMLGAMSLETLSADLGSAEGVSHMIAYSVRWSVPFIYAVVAASALPKLFPGEGTRWLLRNRRYVGLVFALAMAWQGAFIFILTQLHRGHYYADVYLLRNELEGSSGYILLAAMVFTSFSLGRRALSSAQWKVLHRSGVYFLWAYAFSVYWWNVYYYDDPEFIDHVFYWAGFLVFSARIAAWGKTRSRRTTAVEAGPARMLQVLGLGLIVLGIVASATGSLWYETVSGQLLSPLWSQQLEQWLPYWPFEPFLSLLSIGIGVWLLTASPKAAPDPVAQNQDRVSATS